MTVEEMSAPYSKETLSRLMKVLEKYQVLPWLNPVTNSIGIKEFAFNMQKFTIHRPCLQQSCQRDMV